MFTKAIVRKPGKSMVRGLTTAGLGMPEYEIALIQHGNYVRALEKCGVEVIVLEVDEQFPDSTFVEDVALLTKNCAIITNPGAESRKFETTGIAEVLKEYYKNIEKIVEPGSLEGGDVMMVGDHFYIGLSDRTNEEGADQAIAILEKYGMSGSKIIIEDILHLKTGIAYLEENTIIATKEYLNIEAFKQFSIIEVGEDEKYSTNCLWVNGTVLVAAGYPGIVEKITSVGYPVIEVEVSEFRKLDGGLSCLSLRF